MISIKNLIKNNWKEDKTPRDIKKLNERLEQSIQEKYKQIKIAQINSFQQSTTYMLD